MIAAWLLILFLGSGLVFGLGLLAACLAWMKGYRLWFWLISLGPIGALLMLLKPNLNRATTPEEREQWEQRADWTGGILSGITLFFAMGLPILGMATWFSFAAVAVAPAPAAIAVPAQTIEVELIEMPEASPVETTPEAKSNQTGESSADAGNDRSREP